MRLDRLAAEGIAHGQHDVGEGASTGAITDGIGGFGARGTVHVRPVAAGKEILASRLGA